MLKIIIEIFDKLILGKKEFFLSSILSITARAVGAFSGLLLTIVITRKYGEVDSGVFFLCLSIVTFLSMIGKVGLDDSVLKLSSVMFDKQQYDSINGLIIASYKIILFISIIILTLFYAVLPIIRQHFYHNENISTVLEILIFYSPFLSLLTIHSVFFQSMGKTIHAVLFMNVIVNSIFIFAVLTFEQRFWLLPYTLLACGGASLLLCWLIVYWQQKKLSIRRMDIKVLLASSFPHWFVAIVNQVLLWGAGILIGIWHSPDVVAHFFVSQRLTVISVFVLTAVNLVFAPQFAKLYSRKKIKELAMLSRRCTLLSITFSLPIFTIFVIFPQKVMGIFGSDFQSAWLTLTVLAIGQFVNAFTGPVNCLLAMAGYEKDLRNIAVGTMLMILTLSFIFIPTFGSIGGATATAISLIFSNIFAMLMVKVRLGFNTITGSFSNIR